MTGTSWSGSPITCSRWWTASWRSCPAVSPNTWRCGKRTRPGSLPRPPGRLRLARWLIRRLPPLGGRRPGCARPGRSWPGWAGRGGGGAGREAELHEALAKAAADYAKLIELGDELRAVQSEKAGLEDRWLELAEEVAT